MMLKKIMMKLSFLILFPAISLATPVRSAQKILEEMTLTYSQVPYMKSSFVRREVSDLLGTEKKTRGDIEYSLKRIRIEFTKGSKAIFIRGDKKFWHVSEEGEVLTGSVDKAVPNIFVSIFSDPSIWKTLGTKHLNVPEHNIANIEVDPKGKIPNITKMKLKIDTSKRTLINLYYVDDIGNSTSIEFRGSRFYEQSFVKSKNDRFSYKVKKSDTVTNL